MASVVHDFLGGHGVDDAAAAHIRPSHIVGMGASSGARVVASFSGVESCERRGWPVPRTVPAGECVVRKPIWPFVRAFAHLSVVVHQVLGGRVGVRVLFLRRGPRCLVRRHEVVEVFHGVHRAAWPGHLVVSGVVGCGSSTSPVVVTGVALGIMVAGVFRRRGGMPEGHDDKGGHSGRRGGFLAVVERLGVCVVARQGCCVRSWWKRRGWSRRSWRLHRRARWRRRTPRPRRGRRKAPPQ